MNYQSEQINELMGALSKAQGKIESAKKDKKNPFFKSSYADLASVWDACRSSLSESGIAVVQAMEPVDGTLMLVTTLGHSSGQWMKSYMPIVTQKQDPQSLGSAITYMRRYSLAAIVGVAPDEDDDAEGAMGNRHNGYSSIKTPKKTHVMAEEKITEKQKGELLQIIGADTSFMEKIMSWVEKNGGFGLGDIMQKDFEKVKLQCIKNANKEVEYAAAN